MGGGGADRQHLQPERADPPGSAAVAKNASSAGLSERSEILSAVLGTPLRRNTLIGSGNCARSSLSSSCRSTLLHLRRLRQALKRGDDREEFIDGLIKVRYKDGAVSFQNPEAFLHGLVDAATRGGDRRHRESWRRDAIQVTKNLNKKDSGGL